jgi:hypothetical protein
VIAGIERSLASSVTAAVGQLAGQAIMGVLIAQDPSAAVEIDDRRYRSHRIARTDNSDRYLADQSALDASVLDRHSGLGNCAGLSLREEKAALHRTNLEHEGTFGGSVDQRPGTWFQHH